ncbi:MAG: proline--tRNA ligase [Clostridia bacterium]|nr:proline--tRNA ligase [Clostridia bacterium]
MRISKLLGERLKNIPNGVNIKSHIYLLRAGYIKQVSAGIYTLLPPAQRVSLKIQNIIREEMDKIGGQEVLFPVVMPRELWDMSGRYTSIKEEMARFKDRNNHDMVLGMTHEEAAVHSALNTVKSYDQLPFMIYQIQTKFRDEPRPRAGLIRVREFTMKDAYSFHTSQEDLEKYYNQVHEAYERIYKRLGMKNFISVKSDSGMMGGKVAHEFMLLTDIGEDSIVMCDDCGYKANMEVATSILDKNHTEIKELEEFYTGDNKTIEEICKAENIDARYTCKAVCYAVIGDEKKVVVAFIRGDKEINEIKLSKIVGSNLVIKDLEGSGLVKGNIGPMNLESISNECELSLYFDNSLEGLENFIAGANKEGYHYKHMSISRDVKVDKFYDFSKVCEGERCSICGQPLKVRRGIEIGNIFQLGTKYTDVMGLRIQMSDGELCTPIMGCYGIGVGRSLASIAEEKSDAKGLVWPMSIAPWHIYLCPIRIDDENVKTITEEIYKNLIANGFEVLYDDRNISTGAKLTDSELMGMPIRVIISPKTLQNQQAEITIRETGETVNLALTDLLSELKQMINEEEI